ncbi:MAG: helix-turn-helix domain-containing protein [Clostridia bacterium]|nr:helix-turn-helix domain-containing protein [Clostridia bacterium]
MNIYFGENLRNLRRGRNLTQENLADVFGVSFQTVSKWERGDSYPDITMLPEIADFFKVTTDELLGVNRAEKEKEITEKLQEYDNLTDGTLMTEIVKELKAKYPNDFRILIRYLACLVRFSEDKDSVSSEIISIYENIQENCTNDKIRIKAKRSLIEFFRSKAEKDKKYFEECDKIISELPDMRDSREMFCFFCPDKDERIRNTLEEQFLLLHTVYSHYFFYDERFSDEWVLEAFKKELSFLNFVYDDGNYGKMWTTAIYCYGHLGVRYFKLGDIESSLANFRKMADLAVKFDTMDRITVMNSVMFKGKQFDKHTLGSTYSAKRRVTGLLTEKYPLTEEFRNSSEFTEILKLLTD